MDKKEKRQDSKNLVDNGIVAGSVKSNNVKARFERRPSVDIAKSFVELNVKAVIDAEKEGQLSQSERRKLAKIEKRKTRKDRRRKHRVRNIFIGILFLLLIAIVSMGVWWKTSTEAVNLADKNEYQFTVSSGETLNNIADGLEKSGFIKNSLTFRLYARMNRVVIRAGTFNLSPSDSMFEIVNKLTSNQTADITIMIPPGVTLKQLRDIFKKAGFGETDINAALNAEYDHAILADKPKDASLEGYLFPDTYIIGLDDDLEVVIEHALDQFALVEKNNDLRNKFAQQGLSFYEGITLASIITKEVPSEEEQKIVAGVFFNRFAANMPLQSDPTFKYAYAQGLCSSDNTSCESDYNTYKIGGLPPGPIANPSESALNAVANPTASNYIYFLADNDGVTHFSVTLDEQTANINKYYRD